MLRNLLGCLTFSACALNTVVWITPLLIFTALKLLVPIPAFRRLMTRWIMAMGENWISVNAIIFRIVNGTRYETAGVDELSIDKWYLVVVNHQTWVDIIVLQTLLNRRIPFLKFFVKQQLMWFPLLGLAFWALDMPFMKRHSKAYLAAHPEQKGTDLEATRRACRKFHDTPTSVLNFVEGTRYSEEKARRRESPYQYLLPPRAGGIAVTLSAMGETFDALLDITVFYPGGIPTFWDAMCGRFSMARLEVVSRPVEEWAVAGDYHNDREHRRRFHRWLTELWQAKDARLAALHAADEESAPPAEGVESEATTSR